MFAFVSGVLYPLVLSLEELDELILFQLSPAVGVYLVHEVFCLLLVDLHLAGLEHLDDFAFGDTAGIVCVELHEDAQVLLFGALLASVGFERRQVLWNFHQTDSNN